MCHIIDVSQAKRKSGNDVSKEMHAHDKICVNNRVLRTNFTQEDATERNFNAHILKDVYAFDNSLFDVSTQEIKFMDPQQRCLLLAAFDIFMDNRLRWHSSQLCVHVGISWVDFQEICGKFATQGFSAYYNTGTSISVSSGRIAYHFDLQGCAVTVDTACSSSLVALHHAIGNSAKSVGSIVCGVNLILSSTMTHRFNKAGMLSLQHRCQTFDANADGYVRSEACNAILVTFGDIDNVDNFRRNPLHHDISVSCRANQDGTSSGLTVPNGRSQRNMMGALVKEIFNSSKHERVILYTHGTGTPLGDPIEIFASDSALIHIPLKKIYIAEKSMRGHTEPASGLCSLILAVVSASQRRIYGLQHLRELNLHVSKSTEQRYFQRLPEGHAASICSSSVTTISAFAFQGTNAMASLMCVHQGACQELQRARAKRSCIQLDPDYFVASNCVSSRMLQSHINEIHQVITIGSDQRAHELFDHRVSDCCILPATGHIDFQHQLIESVCLRHALFVLERITYVRPLRLLQGTCISIKMKSSGVLHAAQSSMLVKSDQSCSVSRLQKLNGRCKMSSSRIHLSFPNTLKSGALTAFVGIKSIQPNHQYNFQPCIVDAGLQCSSYVVCSPPYAPVTEKIAAPRLPAAIKSVSLTRRADMKCTHSTRLRTLGVTTNMIESNNFVTMTSATGLTLDVSMHKLICKRSTNSSDISDQTNIKQFTEKKVRLLYVLRALRCPEAVSHRQPDKTYKHAHSIMRNMATNVSSSTPTSSQACLHATALLQIAGAQPHAVGTHIRSSDHIRGDGPSMRAGRGVGISASHTSGRSARAVIQSSVQEQSVPLTLSVTSACPSAPVRVLDGSATGVSHTGSLCVDRLVPTFGSQSHTRIHTQTRKHSAGAHVPPSSVFVTGGLGALGQSSTAWHTHLGARYAYVTGRSGRGGSALLRWVSQTGTHNGVLHVSRADASVMDEGSCSGMHAHARVRAHSVLHAGGVLRDSVTARQSAFAHRYVWSSKVTAARVLLQQWAGVERGTRRTTLFSSVAALLGSPGQCNYSGANAALDATATEEWHRGNAVCAMQWGAWDGAGMALSNPAILKQAHTSGIGILDPRAGLGAMRAVLDETDVGRYWRGARGILAVVPFQWSVLMRTYRRRALIAEYSVEPKKDTLRDANTLPSTNQGRARSSDETVSQLVASAVTRALGRDISAEASLMEEGLDSLAAVELGGALQKETGVAMPATLAFDYPTIKAIAGYVNNAMIESSEAHTSDAVVRTSSTEPNAAIRDGQATQNESTLCPGRNDRDPNDVDLCAVVSFLRLSICRGNTKQESLPSSSYSGGVFTMFVSRIVRDDSMIGREHTQCERMMQSTVGGRIATLPSSSIKLTLSEKSTSSGARACDDLELYIVGAASHQHSTERMSQINCIHDIHNTQSETQKEQLNQNSGQHHTSFGYFIQQSQTFDIDVIGIKAKEAQLMDPQQRVLLQNAFSVLCASMHGAPKQTTAVAVGAWTSQYADLCRVYASAPGPYTAVASQLSVLCGRVSYTFGMQGPSICIDTACSSSLVAAHVASAHLRDMECEDALVAGVSVNVGIGTFQVAAAASMLSLDGRCKTLDASADGYAKGECCVVLRVSAGTTTDNATTGSRSSSALPLVVLEHSGVNQDGRSSSLTAPNGPSQQTLMTDVLLRAGVQGGVIDRLEMHGTGTSLGDPIEVGAALEVFASPSSAARHAARPGHALTLEGAKPRAGHCEPGAGVVGMLFAMSHITERTMAPLIHLRELNPHVEAATRRSTRVPHARVPTLPRQAAPRPWIVGSESGRGELATTPLSRSGVSGFAFQGTNAHAIICRRHSPPEQHLSGYTNQTHTMLRSWERQRQWCAPEPHCFVTSVEATYQMSQQFGSKRMLTRSSVRLEHSTALSSMLDHSVGFQHILPGTAHVEIYRAVSGLMVNESHATIAPVQLAFIAPLELRKSVVEVVCDITAQGVARVGVSADASSRSQLDSPSYRSSCRITSLRATHGDALGISALGHARTRGPASMRPVAQNRDQGVRGCVYGSIHSHKTSMSTHTFYAAPAVIDAALHALSTCTTSSTQDTMQSPLVPATIGAVCARGGQHDTRVLCFAILLSPDMHQNVKASSRRSRHHVWEASQPRSHRSCAVHGLESRRLGVPVVSSVSSPYHSTISSAPQVSSHTLHVSAVDDRVEVDMYYRKVSSHPTLFEVETVVVGILESLLHCPVSLQDTLLSQGLDSLGMSQFALELQERFRLALDIKSIFTDTGANQTIHQVIKNIHEATQAEVAEQTPGISNHHSAKKEFMRPRMENVRMFLVGSTASTVHDFLKFIFFWLLIVFTSLTIFTRFNFAERTD